MQKKGQITLFIIVGIAVLTILTVGYVLLKKDSSPETAKVLTTSTISPEVENKLDSCFATISAEALLKIGILGGFLEPPALSIIVDGTPISYYGKGKEIFVPEQSVFADSLEKEIEDRIIDCIKPEDFAPFTLSMGKPEATAVLAERVKLELAYPVTITTEDGSFSPRKDYQAEYPVKISKYIEISKKIIQDASKDPLIVDDEAILAQNFNLDVIPSEDLNIYVLSDDSVVYEERFELRFAYEY